MKILRFDFRGSPIHHDHKFKFHDFACVIADRMILCGKGIMSNDFPSLMCEILLRFTSYV